MAEVSIHPSSTEHFIDRLHAAFLDGDDASTGKSTEASHVSRLQEQYRAIARGGVSPVIDQMAESSELELHGPTDFPINGTWRGRAEVIAALHRNFGSLADQQVQILTLVAQGDTVVLLAQECGKV